MGRWVCSELSDVMQLMLLCLIMCAADVRRPSGRFPDSCISDGTGVFDEKLPARNRCEPRTSTAREFQTGHEQGHFEKEDGRAGPVSCCLYHVFCLTSLDHGFS